MNSTAHRNQDSVVEQINEIQLPFPPPFSRYCRQDGEEVSLTPEGRNYLDKVGAILDEVLVYSFTGALEIRIDFYPPDECSFNLDTRVDSVGDALERANAFQDAHIVTLVVESQEIVPGGKTVVRIKEI